MTRAILILCLLNLPLALLAVPELDAVEGYRHREGEREARWLLRQDPHSPDLVMDALRERRRDRLNYSLLQDGMELCRQVGHYAIAHGDEAALQAAVALADALLRRSVTPSGAFIEWDRNTWLDEGALWRTIPWGVAFGGHRVFDAWQVLAPALSPEQRVFWQESLESTGE
jgi:hypothetical protein